MPSRRTFIESVAVGAALNAISARDDIVASTQATAPGRARIQVFDVNETLLDVIALEPHFVRVFGDGRVLREWFSTVLLYSEVATLAGPYADFGAIGGAALDMTAAARGVSLSADDRTRILTGMLSLPVHPDVRDGLQELRKAGFRLVTLTNSSPKAVDQQLRNAGLSEFFERAFSVDTVRRFKPAAEPYRYVASELKVPIGSLRLIAAHAWDIVGALQAGCVAAFVSRPGKVLYPLGPKPDVVGPDVRSVAAQVVKVDTA
jgi:2-haloacid dehalogenase